MANGIAHILENRFEYNEESLLVVGENNCFVYLIAQGSTNASAKFIELSFHKVKCARSARTDCSPSVGIYPESNEPASTVEEITDSDWPLEAHNSYTYQGTPFRSAAKHFVVTNHDIFHEILAESYEENVITSENQIFPFLKENIRIYE